MLSLLLRNLFFTIVQPGVVAGLVPYLLFRYFGYEIVPTHLSTRHYIAATVFLGGFAIMTACILRFATEGKGTLSPLDPTKRLVINGLYRYSRNPMYVGVMTMLTGEVLFWWSIELAVYAVGIFGVFNAFIMLHEEPRLRREFGPEFEDYASRVGRWI